MEPNQAKVKISNPNTNPILPGNERPNTSIPKGLNRLFKTYTDLTVTPTEKTFSMITKVTAKPNPFSTTITLDVTCEQSKQVIVRMFDEEGRIVKMFSWYLVKGTNVTAINELRTVNSGFYILDIIDHEGVVHFSTKLTK